LGGLFSARLDGTTEKVRSKLAQHASIEDWLELGDSAATHRDGKKRVRLVSSLDFIFFKLGKKLFQLGLEHVQTRKQINCHKMESFSCGTMPLSLKFISFNIQSFKTVTHLIILHDSPRPVFLTLCSAVFNKI
jgi:hypothetical protein